MSEHHEDYKNDGMLIAAFYIKFTLSIAVYRVLCMRLKYYRPYGHRVHKIQRKSGWYYQVTARYALNALHQLIRSVISLAARMHDNDDRRIAIFRFIIFQDDV